MITIAIIERKRSVIVRAARTAHDCIGKARKRSMMPFCKSFASKTPDQSIAKEIVWTKMPAIRKLT